MKVEIKISNSKQEKEKRFRWNKAWYFWWGGCTYL